MADSREHAPCRPVVGHVFPYVLDFDSQWEGQTTIQLHDANSGHSFIVAFYDGVLSLFT